MQVPLEVTFRHVKKNYAMQTLIEEEAFKLEEVCDHIIRCRVAIEQPQKHQKTGNPFRVRIAVTVPPQHEVVVRREPTEGNMHDPLEVVVHSAFQSMRRELTELVRRQHNEVKTHPESDMNAVVVKLFPEDGYGFLQAEGGYEVYFHQNSVLHNKYDSLEIGTAVHYVEEMGKKGPQASTVHVIAKANY